MGNNPVAEAKDGAPQTLSEEVLERLKEMFTWLGRDARDQFKDLNYFEEMLEPISQELPEDISASLAYIFGLEIHYVPIRQALRKVSSRPSIEKKRASAEQAMKGAQSQTESHKDTLANLQASRELKIARKAALEAELRSLSAEIAADDKKNSRAPWIDREDPRRSNIVYG
jgi:predicted RNase H-like nuclease (RuvC/YqgF family)